MRVERPPPGLARPSTPRLESFPIGELFTFFVDFSGLLS